MTWERSIPVWFSSIPWNSSEDIAFRRLTARYTYLEQWGKDGFPFDLDQKFSEETGKLEELQLKYISPEALSIRVDSIDAEIRFVPYAKGSVSQTEATLKYEQFAEIVANTSQPIDWLLEKLQHVQDLLALLVGEPVRKLNLVARLDSSESVSGESEQNIHIFHSVPTPRLTKSIHPATILSAPRLGENLPHIINSWFRPEVFELWDVISDVYFGVLYEAIKVPRFQFLALTQVLESYHRRKLGGDYLSTEDYEPIKKALIQAIPNTVEKGHKETLKSRIHYGYQYSQRKRFSELLELLPDGIQRVLGIATEDPKYRKEYLKRLFATRNYFTHYDPNDKSPIFNDQELQQANSRLAHMIVTLILKEELGLPESLIQGFMEYRRDLGHL